MVSGRVDLQELEKAIEANSRPGDLWILPEVFNTGWNVNTGSPDIDGGLCHGFMRRMSGRFGIAICGSYYEKLSDGRFSNTFRIVSEAGGIDAAGGKRHMFGDFESQHVAPGGMLSFNIGGIRFRAVVCYDLRFPVWCRNTKTEPYDALICVSQWPLMRSADKHLLLSARAMENVAYAINANGIGDSAVYLPDGGKALGVDNGRQLAFYDLDIDLLKDIRKRRRYLLDADDFEIKFFTEI